jgi:hypothetical protein
MRDEVIRIEGLSVSSKRNHRVWIIIEENFSISDLGRPNLLARRFRRARGQKWLTRSVLVVKSSLFPRPLYHSHPGQCFRGVTIHHVGSKRSLYGRAQFAAGFAGVRAIGLQQILINEYAPGAGIGWHRDKPMFEDVIAVSLSSPYVLRLRCKQGTGWERAQDVRPRGRFMRMGIFPCSSSSRLIAASPPAYG